MRTIKRIGNNRRVILKTPNADGEDFINAQLVDVSICYETLLKYMRLKMLVSPLMLFQSSFTGLQEEECLHHNPITNGCHSEGLLDHGQRF